MSDLSRNSSTLSTSSSGFVPFSERFRNLRKEGTGRTVTNRLRLSTAAINPAPLPAQYEDPAASTAETQIEQSEVSRAVVPAKKMDRMQQLQGIFENRGARTGIKFNTSQIERDEDGFFDINDFFAKTRRDRNQHIATVVSARQQSANNLERNNKRQSVNIFHVDANDLDLSTTSSRITSTSMHTTKTMTTPGGRSDHGDDISYMTMTSVTDDDNDDLSSVSSNYYSDVDEGDRWQEFSTPSMKSISNSTIHSSRTPARTTVFQREQEQEQPRLERVPPAVASLLASGQKAQRRPGTPVLDRRITTSHSVSTPSFAALSTSAADAHAEHGLGIPMEEQRKDQQQLADDGGNENSAITSTLRNRTNLRVQPPNPQVDRNDMSISPVILNQQTRPSISENSRDLSAHPSHSTDQDEFDHENDTMTSLGFGDNLNLRMDLNTSMASMISHESSSRVREHVSQTRDDVIEELLGQDDVDSKMDSTREPYQTRKELMDDEDGDDNQESTSQFPQPMSPGDSPGKSHVENYHQMEGMDYGFGGDFDGDFGGDFDDERIEETEADHDAHTHHNPHYYTPVTYRRPSEGMSTPKTPGLLAKVKPHTMASVRKNNRRKHTDKLMDNYDELNDSSMRSPFHKTRVKDRAVVYSVELDESDDELYEKDKSFVSSETHTSDDEDAEDEASTGTGLDSNDLSVIHHTEAAATRPRRKRVPPLEFWRHEKLDERKKHILRPKTPVSRKRKANASLKRPGPVERKKGRFDVKIPNGRERKQTIVRTADMVMEDIIQFDNVDTGELGIVSYFANPGGSHWRSGVLKVYPESEKPLQSSKDHTEVFYVVSGSVQVEINQSTFTAQKGAQFFVPPNNTYAIVNTSSTQLCKLVYFSMGGVSSATNASTLTLNNSSMDSDIMPPPRARISNAMLSQDSRQNNESSEDDSDFDSEDDDAGYAENDGNRSTQEKRTSSKTRNSFYKGGRTRRRKQGTKPR